MISENPKTGKTLEKLGLPPMELAESTERGSLKSGVYKNVYTIVQKLLWILLLITLGAGTYVILMKLPEHDVETENAEIIILKNNESADFTFHEYGIKILLEVQNKTKSETKRRKRQAVLPPGTTVEVDDPFANLRDDELQKARDIIMKHDMLCNEQSQQEVCKDLVMQLYSLTENSKHNNPTTERPNIPSSRTFGTSIPAGFRRGSLPMSQFDHFMDSIPHIADEGRDAVPHANPTFLPYPQIVAPNQPHEPCPLSRLLKHNHPLPREFFDPTFEGPHLDHPFLPQSRQFVPMIHPYLESREAVPRRKFHPQDVEIFMSFLTPKPETSPVQNQGNFSSRDVECPANTMPCKNVDLCIGEKQWCDGNVDCPDVSDESRCSCKSRIDQSRICDGYFDCPFGEDELGCFGCRDNTFSCEDLDLNSRSTCFSKEQRCNNVVDCPNHKDEIECNMLAPSLIKKPLFAISNTEGFLHRNFKGDWYAVCKNPYMWAHDACRRETGLIIRPPFIQIVPIDPLIKMQYLNTGPGGLIQTSSSCWNSSAVYVTCPDLLCGTRVQSTSQFLRENFAIENHLFGRNKRFLLSNHPYPLMFYGNRLKRNVDDSSMKTDNDIKFGTFKGGGFDKIRNKRTESRVVGGKPSQPAAWPWMVAVYRNGMFHCGGVVISHSWIVSAAHCVSKFWDHYYEVQVGMLRRFSFSPQEQSHRVTHVIVNQHYSQSDMKNDLSLLRVEPSIQFNRWVRPICLPGPDTAGPDWLWGPSPGTICTAVGWGATIEHGPDPDHMREVEVPVWENCKHREDRAGKEICAGLIDGGKDACQGDSGGPLLCRNPLNSQQWYMAGIVSHGDGCGRKGEPGVYTRVSLFVKWIRYHISSKSLPIVQPVQDCPGFKCESGISKCLPNKRKCDMVIDCLDGEDEKNCEYTIQRSAENVITESTITSVTSSDLLVEETITPKMNEHKTTITTEDLSTKATTEINKEISEILKNTTGPDFEHASTIEMPFTSISTESVEDFSTEPVTEKELSTESRGDSETIMVDVIGHSLESRSSVLEKLKQQETDPEEITTENVTMQLAETSITTNKNFEITTVSSLETTTAVNLNNDSDSIKVHDEIEHNVLDENNRKKAEELIIELLPNSNTLPDEISQDTKDEFQNVNINTFPEDKKNNFSNKILPDDKSEIIHQIEDSVFSELQPAKIRRKHRVPKEFECRRIFQVIPYTLRCDHKPDCEDATDELGCTCIDYLSTFDQNLICDGVFDCADGQDEADCYGCSDNRFLCKRSQICLPIKHVCDGKPHCPEGEDEQDCFALSNGKEILYEIDERPKTNLEGYLTKKHFNDWHVVCNDKLTLEEQDQAATHICRYLGFSDANRYLVKYINIKEDEIAPLNSDLTRNKRNVVEKVPVHFAYKQEGDTARHIVIQEPQFIKEQCVPNITKTCKSLYVFCEHSLFTNFEDDQSTFLRDTDNGSKHIMWPWIAKVYVEGEYKCTGILVTLSWVLVSESCLWDATLLHHFTTVSLGSHRTIGSVTGMHEQTYCIDSKKHIYRSKVVLLHLHEPAHYSNLVKPMIISSAFVQFEKSSNCVAVGQDDKNNTVSVFLEETNDHCHTSNRCFIKKTRHNVCSAPTTLNRHWAGIVSCHTEQGWYPIASFVDSRGECKLGNTINGTEIENLRNEIKHFSVLEKNRQNSTLEHDSDRNCEGKRCGRGKCIPMAQICDGVKHCEDGKDESEGACEKKNIICADDPFHSGCECSAGQMKCRNGKCISKELFKDGNDDCGDKTDEPVQTTCSDYLARVMPSRLCDGILHCQDRSDEDPMFCKCFAKRNFKCGTRSGEAYHCVSPDVVCDGIKDCPSGEDERTCIALNTPPGKPHGTGQVIVRSHGVWHSKCYPTQNHTKSELEEICKDLGFFGGHAKELKNLQDFVIHPHNDLVLDSFSEVPLNNNTIIKIRNAVQPLARPVVNNTLQNCFPVVIECL